MKNLLLCVAIAALSACAEKVTRPDGTKASAAFVAHELSVQAYATKAATAAVESKQALTLASSCDQTAATIADDTAKIAALGMCSLRLLAANGQAAGAKSAEAPPTYVAPPSMLDRVAQFAPLIMSAGQMVAADQASQRQNEISLELARINAGREQAIVQAATGSNERIATGGYSAIGTVAGSAITALSAAATSANQATVANSQSWAGALGALPATTQIIAGRDVIQARDVDQSATGRDRVTGDGNEVNRNVDCVASGGPGGSSTGTNAGSASGTTSPASTSYNALTSGNGAEAGNSCGN